MNRKPSKRLGFFLNGNICKTKKPKILMLFGGPMRKIIKPQLGTVRYNLKESKESLLQSRKESPISL